MPAPQVAGRSGGHCQAAMELAWRDSGTSHSKQILHDRLPPPSLAPISPFTAAAAEADEAATTDHTPETPLSKILIHRC